MLVPADKPSNNVIVVCKKYYLDVVIKELSLNNTYKEVHSDCVNMKSTKVQTLGGWYIRIFVLKTPCMHMY